MIAVSMLLACSGNKNGHLTGSGVLEGTEIVISSQSSGQITKLAVDEGDELQKDESIAEIDTELLRIQSEQVENSLIEIDYNILNARAAISQAETQFENVHRRYQRIKALYENNAATKQQMDDAETQDQTIAAGLTQARNTLNALLARKKQVESNLQLNRKRIGDAHIKSPIQGIVIDKFIEQGEMVTLGSPLVIIADLSALWIKLYIKEDELGFVNLGNMAEISIDSFPDRIFTGKVVWISQKAEFTPKNVQTKDARADLVYAVKISVPNESGILKIGMPADISLRKTSRRTNESEESGNIVREE